MAFSPEGLLQLEDVSANVQIVNLASSVQISQRFFNKSDSPLEVCFEIQLIDNATIVEFNAKLEDGTILIGKVKESEQAVNTYDDAIASGSSAFLVEKQSSPSNWFTCSLGSVPPKSRITISLRYVSLLDLKDNSIVFHMNKIMNNYQQFYKKLSCSLNIDIHLGNFIEDIICMTNENAVVQFTDDKTQATVSIAAQDFTQIPDLWVDKPVSLTIITKDVQTMKWIIEEHASKESDFACMLHFAPLLNDILPEAPQEFVFVLDRSGSMSGSKMTSAKNALQIFLRSLPVGYFFNIIGFGTNYSKLYDHCVAYNQESFQRSTKHVDQIEANLGGTDIYKPLANVFSDKSYKTNSKRVVFLITDGCVSDPAQVVQLVSENVHTHKVFCVGIGFDADHKLLSDIAKVSGTKPVMVGDNDRLESKIMECVRMALTPVVKNVVVNWELPGCQTVKTSPQYQIPEFYDGDCSFFYAWIKKKDSSNNNLSGKVVLKATTEVPGDKFGEMVSKEHSWEIEMNDSVICKVGNNNSNNNSNIQTKFPLISSLAAKARVDELLMYKSKTNSASELDRYKQEIISLGQQYNIASEFCSFVVVAEGNEATQHTMKRVDVKPSSQLPKNAQDLRRANLKKKKDKKEQARASQIAQSNHPGPSTAAGINTGAIVMINGHPCRLVEKSMSKTGKHGHAKVHLVGVDPVTGKKFETIMPATTVIEMAPVPEEDNEDLEDYEDEEDESEEEKPVAKPAPQIGGKGTQRRKHKAAKKKPSSTDDKKLQSTLTTDDAQSIPGVEQVDMYKEDGTIIHFDSPQGKNDACLQSDCEVKSDPTSNMLMVTGSPQIETEKAPTYTPPPTVQKMDSSSLEGLLQPLIQLQQLDGKWELTQQLSTLIQIPLTELNNLVATLIGSDPSYQAVLATIVAVCICEKCLPHRKDEWNLLVKKAWSWLKVQEAAAKGSWRSVVVVSKVSLFLKSKTKIPVQ